MRRVSTRRYHAQGLCIATANAQVAHRRGKRVFAELDGARELLADLERTARTQPRVCLALQVQLPSERARPYKVAEKLLEDIALWMGWPDETLLLSGEVPSHKLVEGGFLKRADQRDLLRMAGMARDEKKVDRATREADGRATGALRSVVSASSPTAAPQTACSPSCA